MRIVTESDAKGSLKWDTDQIIEEAFKVWMAEDGLMRLEPPPEDNASPYSGDLRSVYNDNGILFLAQFILMIPVADQKKAQDFVADTILYLEWDEPGVFYVNHGRTNNFNSHDNVIAIATLSALYDFRFHDDIVYRGNKDAFTFESEGAIRYGDRIMGRRKVHIQPIDRAYLKLLTSCRATNWEYLNLVVGLVQNLLQFRTNMSKKWPQWWRNIFEYNGSSTLLNMVRVYGMRIAADDAMVKSRHYFWMYSFYNFMGNVWLSVKDLKYAFDDYYKNEKHPNRRLAALLYRR